MSDLPMKTVVRKWIGAEILGISILIGLLLHLLGVPLLALVRSESETDPGFKVIAWGVHIHWPLAILLASGSIGFLSLVIQPKKRPPPKIHTKPE